MNCAGEPRAKPVYTAGTGPDGKPRVSTTVCPGRLLAESPHLETILTWFVASGSWDGMSGTPSGPPEWPYRGGMLRQPGPLVDAVIILRDEFPYVQQASKKRKRPTDKKPEGRRARREARA